MPTQPACLGPVEEEVSVGAFLEKLGECSSRNHSLLCVGLDPDLERLPDGFSRDTEGIVEFNRVVIEATSDLVCAYKPNLAFYEALGIEGLRALEETVLAIPSHVPTIADAKRGDVPNTARYYAAAFFDEFGFDSITVSPYLGPDSLEPFLEREGKGVWVLCRTSNPGASAVQDWRVSGSDGDSPVYLEVVEMVLSAPSAADKGVVVGATSPEVLRRVRERAPQLPLLIPGLGAQGGDEEAAVRAAATGPVVINSSRGVLYGPQGGDPVAAVRRRALEARDRLNSLLASVSALG